MLRLINQAARARTARLNLRGRSHCQSRNGRWHAVAHEPSPVWISARGLTPASPPPRPLLWQALWEHEAVHKAAIAVKASRELPAGCTIEGGGAGGCEGLGQAASRLQSRPSGLRKGMIGSGQQDQALQQAPQVSDGRWERTIADRRSYKLQWPADRSARSPSPQIAAPRRPSHAGASARSLP